MRAHGSLPFDPYGTQEDLAWVDLDSCRIVVDEEEARELLAFLERVGRLGDSRSDHYHLRSERPNHGDAGRPDVTVYPEGGPR